MDQLLRMEQVAEFLNISPAKAYQMARAKELPTVHLGRAVRVRLSDLEKFVEDKVEAPLL
jgi:excisionase family DNA binding protein